MAGYRSASFEGLTFRFGTSLTTVGLTGTTYGGVKVGCSVSSYGSIVRGTCVLRQFVYISKVRPGARLVSGLFGRLVLFATETI